MKKILVNMDEETFNLLEGETNRSETVRQSIRVYKGDILPETVEGMRAAFGMLSKKISNTEDLIKEVDSKVDYIASRLEKND